MKFIVYQTTNLINNKIYVGVHKTNDPEIFDGYLANGIYINSPSSYMYPITPFQYAVKKYGPSNFRRSTLKVFDTPKEAYKLEEEIVDYNFIRRKDVYNAKVGGLGGCSYYVTTYQFDEEGNLLKEWASIMEASEFYGVSHTAIMNAMKYKGSCKKYFWSREKTIDVKEYSLNIGTICYLYSEEGKYLETFNSIPEASKETGCCMQELLKAIKGGYKCKGHYYSNKLYEEYTGKPKMSIKGKTLYVYNLDGEYLTELHSGKEITEYFNIKNVCYITTAMKVGRPYKLWLLSLEKVDSLPPVINKRNISKPIAQYTLTGDLVREFKSITEAINEFGTGVNRVLKGQQQHCKNFIFRYL